MSDPPGRRLSVEKCGAVTGPSNSAPTSAQAHTPTNSVGASTSGPTSDVAAGRRCDSRWGAGFLQWVFDLSVLVALGAIAYLGTDWALARKEPLPQQRQDNLVGHAWRAVRRGSARP